MRIPSGRAMPGIGLATTPRRRRLWPGQHGHCPLQPGQCPGAARSAGGAEQAYLAALALEPSHQDAQYNLTLLRAQPPEATPQAQDHKPIDAPEQAATPDAPLPPSPPVLLLEQRLRKEDQRRRQQRAIAASPLAP